MEFSAETLDDCLGQLYPELLRTDADIATTRGQTSELLGALLEIRSPRARLSRTETRGRPFSALGELLWYLSRDNRLDFIRNYVPAYAAESEDGVTINGGYGPRLFSQRGNNQIANILQLLRQNPSSRRAVVQLFNAEDISRRFKEVPCTTTLQFIFRDGRLHMLTTMRSNDAYMGLPHDVFCFTMLQEIIARSLGAELGVYKHFAGSMHLYGKNRESVQAYLGEAVQPRVQMPEMPQGDPWPSIRALLQAELQIRRGENIDAENLGLAPYWADLVRLLQIFEHTGDERRISALKSAMNFKRYAPYIDACAARSSREPPSPTEPFLRV